MKKGRFAALLTACLLVCPLTGCGSQGDPADPESEAEQTDSDSGKEAKSSSSKTDSKKDSSSSTTDRKDSKTDSSKTDSSSGGSGRTNSSGGSSSGNSSSGGSSSGGNNSSGGSSSGGNNSSGGSNSGGNSSSGGSSGGNNSSGGSSSGRSNSSGGSSGGNNNAGGEQTPAEPVEETPDNPVEDDPEEQTDPVKYIYLQDTTAQYSGDGITVNGSVVTIGKGGTYEITGTLSNGQIYIMTDKKKVRLHFNNASITNHAGSAINCQNAKRLTLKSLPGTVNYLEDGGTHDLDKGTVFSEDTVYVKGEGVLNIKANYAHGIQSDDDIIVNGSTLNITAAKSCLHSNDGIEINGGSVFCDGGTNGIKTDGYITITGGRSVFLGGTREEKGAIYCDGIFTVTGGCFYAVGNTCTAPDASTTSANVIGVMFPSAQPANTAVNVASGNNGIFTVTSPRSFKYVVYTGPNLLLNAEYRVNTGGTPDGGAWENYVYNGGSYSGGTDCGSFTAGNPVTFYTVP